jgi:hypothetical protein
VRRHVCICMCVRLRVTGVRDRASGLQRRAAHTHDIQPGIGVQAQRTPRGPQAPAAACACRATCAPAAAAPAGCRAHPTTTWLPAAAQMSAPAIVVGCQREGGSGNRGSKRRAASASARRRRGTRSTPARCQGNPVSPHLEPAIILRVLFPDRASARARLPDRYNNLQLRTDSPHVDTAERWDAAVESAAAAASGHMEVDRLQFSSDGGQDGAARAARRMADGEGEASPASASSDAGARVRAAVSEREREALRARLADNFQSLLFHREVRAGLRSRRPNPRRSASRGTRGGRARPPRPANRPLGAARAPLARRRARGTSLPPCRRTSRASSRRPSRPGRLSMWCVGGGWGRRSFCLRSGVQGAGCMGNQRAHRSA